MVQVSVEHGIPLPGKIVKEKAKLHYKDLPFDEMIQYSSFALGIEYYSSLSTAISSYRYSRPENLKKEFTLRKDQEKQEVRVWRVK